MSGSSGRLLGAVRRTASCMAMRIACSNPARSADLFAITRSGSSVIGSPPSLPHPKPGLDASINQPAFLTPIRSVGAETPLGRHRSYAGLLPERCATRTERRRRRTRQYVELDRRAGALPRYCPRSGIALRTGGAPQQAYRRPQQERCEKQVPACGRRAASMIHQHMRPQPLCAIIRVSIVPSESKDISPR